MPTVPDLSASSDAVPARRIAGPDRRHEPVAHVVGDADRVLLVLERGHGDDRAEDLFLRDLGVVGRRDDGGG